MSDEITLTERLIRGLQERMDELEGQTGTIRNFLSQGLPEVVNQCVFRLHRLDSQLAQLRDEWCNARTRLETLESEQGSRGTFDEEPPPF